MNKQSDKKTHSIYIPIVYKFIIAFILSALWVAFSVYLSLPWLQDLARLTNWFLAVFIVTGIAYAPGWINAFLIVSILLDKQPQFTEKDPEDEVTLLIAAYNEEAGIYNTLKYVASQDYKGKIRTIVINNNSNDKTRDEVERAAREMDLEIECLDEPT
ncbi:MAG: glycosyltransferase family 2 protein, partial [Eubacteriales bacterium]|nr:glycosyltransferase family 2 protein [Eubacteriales bacterium]